ncbi:PPOX class F420-dependent oxidoreductase [Saccharopolyspora shandongensis]|uniref:PPOX class probable F420-dependent enzyme n=1 Tax=Saccharopolyspora shandongensis TaxID=418495 RepID=A0A1H3P843_9PSEU|nr:PPOX class F420-dependent oxidoreductase [Saccharopolyspora shandongensis]SDY97267.1 PPOX class probable F420-dependent enzyme [Saccharopolyspora shandongensis]
MPKEDLPPDLQELLSRPNPAVIATVNTAGAPVSVATWYLWDGGKVLVNMDAGRARLKHLRADPRVSLTVLDGENWYRHISLRGRVIALEDDPDLTDIDRLARHYTGEQYPVRDRPRISGWIEVTSWHNWGG